MSSTNTESILLPQQRITQLRCDVHEAALRSTQEIKASSPFRLYGSIFVVFVTITFAVMYPADLFPYSENTKTELAKSVPAHPSAKEVLEERWIPHLLTAQAFPLPKAPTPPPVDPPKPLKSIGVYLTGNSIARGDEFLERTLQELAKLPHPALVIDVKENYVLYTSHAPLAESLQTIRAKYDLPTVIKKANDFGIQTIARFVAAKDRGLAVRKSNTHIRHPVTKLSLGSTWVDPANPFVLQYNRELLQEIISAGVDEVNIDYIRYPTEYSPQQIGLTPLQKIDNVKTFISMARSIIDESNSSTRLGISTYAIIGWDYDINVDRLGQDVARFAPLVDVISPMAYPASFANGYYYTGKTGRSRMYELVFRTLEGYKKFLDEEHHYKLRPWLQGYRVKANDLRDQIDAVEDVGLCGFTIWNPSNTYKLLYQAMEGHSIAEDCGEER